MVLKKGNLKSEGGAVVAEHPATVSTASDFAAEMNSQFVTSAAADVVSSDEAQADAERARRDWANDEPTAEVVAEAQTAIAVAKATAVAAPKKFTTVLTELERAIDPDAASALIRVKSGSGTVKDADGFNYGRHIDLELVSWHSQWAASPGSDKDEDKELVRYSLDGSTIAGDGESIQAYVESLKAQGYEEASLKRYVILVGIIEAAEKTGGRVGDLVQVSLSPQSLRSFDSYRLQRSVKVRMGRESAEGAENVRITAESKSKGSKDFTLLQVTGR